MGKVLELVKLNYFCSELFTLLVKSIWISSGKQLWETIILSQGPQFFHNERFGVWKQVRYAHHHNLFLIETVKKGPQKSFKPSKSGFEIPYARHYNPRFVYFLPTFWSPKTFFQGAFFLKFWPHVWLVFKSGL